MLYSIIVIDEDTNTVELIRDACESLGFDSHPAYDGQTGLELALDGNYDMVICDINAPKLGGFELLHHLKLHQSSARFILLSARADDEDKVLGLTLGADDFVTKPFSIMELTARIRSIIRRQRLTAKPNKVGPSPSHIVAGPLEVDKLHRRVTFHGKAIALTKLEFELLAYLTEANGSICTRYELLERVWGYSTSNFSTIPTVIMRLRKKLNSHPPQYSIIQTVRQVGYRLCL